MAYKLQLPEGAKIHPVFHVSLLKRSLTAAAPIAVALPESSEEGQILAAPKRVLEQRRVRKDRRLTTEVLVKWYNLPVEQATWGDYDDLKTRFPELILEDKDLLKGEGL